MARAQTHSDGSSVNDPNYHPHDQGSVDWNPSGKMFREHVSRYVYASKLAAGGHALDIGCGKGYGTYYLAKLAKSAEGLDMNAASIDVARAHFRGAHLSYRVGDALKVATLGKSFDVITAFEIIEHLPPAATDHFLCGIGRLLAPGGKALISTPNHDVVMKSGVPVPDFHINNFRATELRAKLKQHFKQVTMIGQFNERPGVEGLLFTLDLFNARHLLSAALKPLFKSNSSVQNPHGDHHDAKAQAQPQSGIDAAFFDGIYDSFGDFRFSRMHWRQAGLTLALCEDPIQATV